MPRPSSICTSRRAPKTADSPLPSTPSASPSSPSSFPSSPSTTSPGRMVSGYREDEDGERAGSNGVCVSSTSNPSRPYGQREDTGTEMYDPFQPTEGDGGPGEDEGDKYDPFEPTGSPVSEKEEERDEEREEGDDGVSKADLETPPEDDGPPPDSTEALKQNRIMKFKEKTRERRRSSRERSEYDSEIEEGEIVGAGEGVREVAIRREVLLPSSGSPSFLAATGLKPERILRVLDGEDFVSVRAEGEWEAEPAPQIGAGDLRRKLTNRRKQRFRSCPSSASVSPPPAPTAGQTPPLSPPPAQAQTGEKSTGRKSSKSSKERERRKRKGQDKDKRKKRKDGKAESSRGSGESKDREGEQERRGRKEEKDKEPRRSKSLSRSRKSAHHVTPEPVLQSHNASSRHARQSWSRERNRDRDRDRDREKVRERDRYRDRRRDDRDRERDSRRKEGRKRDADETGRRSSSRERGHAKRRRDGSERRDQGRDRGRDHDRRNNRPVVPPSIQDLNGPELFAIKRTITVTPAPAARLSGSPPHARVCSQSPQDSDKSRRHRRKRRRNSEDEDRPAEEHGTRSHNSSLTPLRYHNYESDRPEPDMLSLDGEALDSDYPSLEDSPLLPPPLPEPLVPSPKPKSSPQRSNRHHQKKKSRSRGKKPGQTEAAVAVTHRPKPAGKPSLSASSGNTTSLPMNASTSAKRGRKTGKDKPSKKSSGRSGRSKKAGGRKTKLQSKVSVLVREGVSSTTGNSGKLGLDLLGPIGPAGPSVGGSIAVVFRRDNESRSPFLKPCSEPLSLPGRPKELGKTGKARSALSGAGAPGLKSKKVKPSSTTSTSSSASSPTSSLAAKRRRRPGRKPREKGPTAEAPDSKDANGNSVWAGGSPDIQPLGGGGPKPSSPPSALLGPAPSSSSSSSSSTSSTSVLPPSSSPPHTPPPSLPPSRDTRESSPDSQTVDSSCKTPEPSFHSDECPAQSQSATLAPSKSPPSPPPQRIDAVVQSASKPPPPDELEASPPRPVSTAPPPASLSVPPTAVEPSSSSSASVSSSSVTKPPPLPAIQPLPWNLQTGMDCTAGGVLALTALLFKMEEANLASRAKAQEFIQATSQILSQANPPQTHAASSSQIPPPPPPPSHAPPPGPASAQFILHGSLPLVGCTKTPPSHLHPGISLGGGYAQTPPPPLPAGLTGSTGGTSETSWDGESKDPDKYLKKLHTQERAVEEVKLAIKPYYQRKDINKEEYKDILRKAVHKICHSRTGEINPVKVSNLVKLYVQRYKYFRKHGRKMDDDDREEREAASLHPST